jgi:hypothetical protein
VNSEEHFWFQVHFGWDGELTSDNVLIGTPCYMAPELLLSRGLTAERCEELSREIEEVDDLLDSMLESLSQADGGLNLPTQPPGRDREQRL